MNHEIDKSLLLKHIQKSDLLGREKMYLEELVHRTDWIPCSERLPEIGVPALICALDGCRTTARYCADGEWRLTTGGFLHDSNVVTHWMPLPELPEDKENENRNENERY